MSDTTVRAEVQESVQHLMEVAQAQGLDDELVVALLRESAELISRRQPRGGALSTEQVNYLVESGAFSEGEFAQIEAGVARGDLVQTERTTRLAAITETLSAAEVALRLGLSASRIRHRQAKGGLYGFLSGGKRRYPTWQLTNDSAQPVLPGLAAVVKALPGDMHPASFQGFMTTPQANLCVSGEPMTPVEWLRNGGNPQVLVGILSSVLQS
ncbi:hypothetical protein [Cryobacterium sp. N19]|uniref:hypothetical protein n=1 Tax=Cryobacterium sp. N19 TaxID=2048288 RepID=UPI000CE53558|nr:hypothetical protein [Cryobacterium sp. N19]